MIAQIVQNINFWSWVAYPVLTVTGRAEWALVGSTPIHSRQQ